MLNLDKYDAFEINPVTWIDATKDSLMRCDENEKEIVAWSVYGRIPNAGAECLADCHTKEIAEILGQALADKFGVELHRYYRR